MQSYREPGQDAALSVESVSAMSDLPLPAGTLEHNLGVAIVVVCTNVGPFHDVNWRADNVRLNSWTSISPADG